MNKLTAYAALVERLNPENKQLERFRVKLKTHHRGNIEPVFKRSRTSDSDKVLIGLKVNKWTPAGEVLEYLKKEFPDSKITLLRS